MKKTVIIGTNQKSFQSDYSKSKYQIFITKNIFPLSFRRVRVGSLFFDFTLEALEDVRFNNGVSISQFFARLKSGYYDRLFEYLVRNGERVIKSNTLMRYHQAAG